MAVKVTVRLSEESRAGWMLAESLGVSITALMEARGLMLAEGYMFDDEVIDRARAIEMQRRSRRLGR